MTEPPRRSGTATALGWFSVGLGATQLLAPAALARMVGLRATDGTTRVMRVMGGRELATGLGVLGSTRPAPFLWARVAGDGLDAALLANGLRDDDHTPGRLAASLAAVAGTAALDTAAAVRASRARRMDGTSSGPDGDGRRHSQLRATTTLAVSPHDAYAVWRDLERLPRFMTHLERVTVLDDRRSHWVAHGPAGTKVAWDAAIVDDAPGERIAWRSEPGAAVPNEGRVTFRTGPNGRGTEVHVEITYSPPGGTLGTTVARLLGEEPHQQVSDDLRRFKQLVETGEIARSDGSPRGLRTDNLVRRRPGRPLPDTDRRTSRREEESP